MRRKKPRVVWLPSTNANSVGPAAGPFTTNIQQVAVDMVSPTARGDTAIAELPLIIDGDLQNPLDPASSLSDVENGGYRLRRIVGNIWIAAAQSQNAGVKAVVVTAGLIIRSYDPISGFSTQLTSDPVGCHPGEIRNISDPWIWRRSWVITNILSTLAPVANAFQLSGQTHNFANQEGALGSGSHVDARTARLVGPEHRLFLDVGITSLDTVAAAGITFETDILLDLRVLGSMRTNVGNRRNASR